MLLESLGESGAFFIAEDTKFLFTATLIGGAGAPRCAAEGFRRV